MIRYKVNLIIIAIITWILFSLPAWSIPATVTVNVGSVTGGVLNKDMLGVNHGPIHVNVISPVFFDYESGNWTDLSGKYIEAKLSWVRTD